MGGTSPVWSPTSRYSQRVAFAAIERAMAWGSMRVMPLTIFSVSLIRFSGRCGQNADKMRRGQRGMVAGARNHLQADRPLEFSFEIAT